MIRIIYALPLLVLCVLGVMFAQTMIAQQKTELIQRATPTFSMPDILEDDRIFSNADFAQSPSIVTFFATWCPPCLINHKRLMILANEYNVPVYGFAYKDKLEDLDRFFEQHGNPYRKIGFDDRGLNFMAWGITGTPENLIIDRTGTIRYHHKGLITPDDLRNKILPLLNQLEQENTQ